MRAPDMSQPDHFELFNLPARFALDASALDQAYRQVQAQVHPDRHVSGGAAQRRVAMQWAAQANEAYRTLKSPRGRAAYLCERAGVAVEGESNTAMSAAFLMRQLELREALDAARERGDRAQFAQLGAATDSERGKLIDELGRALDQQADHVRAAGLVRQLMFIEKLAAEIGDAQFALESSAQSD